jgi:hypothetical protein
VLDGASGTTQERRCLSQRQRETAKSITQPASVAFTGFVGMREHELDRYVPRQHRYFDRGVRRPVRELGGDDHVTGTNAGHELVNDLWIDDVVQHEQPRPLAAGKMLPDQVRRVGVGTIQQAQELGQPGNLSVERSRILSVELPDQRIDVRLAMGELDSHACLTDPC